MFAPLLTSPTTVGGELVSLRKKLERSRNATKMGTGKKEESSAQSDDGVSALQAMLQKEDKMYRSQCLQELGILFVRKEDQSPVLEWFRMMTEWCYAVADRCKLPLEVVEVTVNLLDRFLHNNCESEAPLPFSPKRTIASHPKRNSIFGHSSRFQVVTITCLYIASKAICPRYLTPALLEKLSKNEVLARDIETMELAILSEVKFKIDPPTIVSYALQMLDELQLWNADTEEEEHIKEQQESLFMHLVEQQARFATSNLYPFHISIPSIALASVRNALLVMEAQSLFKSEYNSLVSVLFQKAWSRLESQVRAAYKNETDDFDRVQDRLQTSLRLTTRQAAFEWKRKDNEDENNMIYPDDWSSSRRLLQPIQEG